LTLAIAAALRLHVDVVIVEEGHLIVRQQISIVEATLFGNERVVDDVGKRAIEELADNVDESRMLRVLPPLPPA
jgi:hypothetical protein